MRSRPRCRAVALLLGLAAALGSAKASTAPELLSPHLVAVSGTRRLNINCIGSGSPTVVFEQGGEGFISNWGKVQPAISALTRACFYDRAGFGYSDPPDKPVTALSVTDDLDALLRNVGVRGPVVLVGHSIGGFYATMYTDRFPEAVAGLVLVDPGFSGQVVRLSPDRTLVWRAMNRKGEGYLVRCAALARAGNLVPGNLSANHCMTPPADSSPEELRYILHAVLGPSWYEAEESQSVNYFTGDDLQSVSHAQETQASRPFESTPIVVLTRSEPLASDWRTSAETALQEEHWKEGHRKLASRSTRGRWTVVPGSGHFIQRDKPDAVIQAITSVVLQSRRPNGVAFP